MSAKKARLPMVVLGLLLATASWLGASGSQPQPAAPGGAALATAPLAANSCPAAAAAGGNCSDNSDCPGGYCYHDPIALVPYCVYGQVDTFQPPQP